MEIIKKIKNLLSVKILSNLETFAIITITLASNQRCWFVMYEDKMPDGYKKFRRF